MTEKEILQPNNDIILGKSIADSEKNSNFAATIQTTMQTKCVTFRYTGTIYNPLKPNRS